jgi:hypothetical protein
VGTLTADKESGGMAYSRLQVDGERE